MKRIFVAALVFPPVVMATVAIATAPCPWCVLAKVGF
jgi:hypothetical protein